jgi:hypothetical protein
MVELFVNESDLSPKQQLEHLRTPINKAAYFSSTFRNQCKRVRGCHKGAAKNWGLTGCYVVFWVILRTFRKLLLPWKDREYKTKRHCVTSQMTQMFTSVDSGPAAVQITDCLVKYLVIVFWSEICANFYFLHVSTESCICIENGLWPSYLYIYRLTP